MSTDVSSRSAQEPRFEELTETTGIPVTTEGAVMLYTRYDYAARMATGKRVLELGCAAGQGFGLLARNARSVVGGDYSMPLLTAAHAHYGERVPLVRLSAEYLPFADRSFDVLFMFEASYYVPDMERAIDEMRRVLAPSGELVFVNANPRRPDFIRSPHSVHYHTPDEFTDALRRRGFSVEIEGAFPLENADPGAGAVSRARATMFSLLRRGLEAAHLTPRTLRGRARLKRLISPRMRTVPPELQPGFASSAPRVPLTRQNEAGFKVLYVTARLGR